VGIEFLQQLSAGASTAQDSHQLGAASTLTLQTPPTFVKMVIKSHPLFPPSPEEGASSPRQSPAAAPLSEAPRRSHKAPPAPKYAPTIHKRIDKVPGALHRMPTQPPAAFPRTAAAAMPPAAAAAAYQPQATCICSFT